MPVPLEPNWVILLAPGADANEVSPDWVDVSADLLALPQISRGSPAELDRNNPAAATFVLDNWSGDYDNENAASPYVGDIVPMTQVLIYAEFDGELYPRFRGFLDDVQLDYPGEGQATATFLATDGFKPLAQSNLATSAYAQEVLADTPTHWWRLGEPEGATTAFDAAGGFAGDYLGGPTLGGESLVSREAGTSATFAHTSTQRAEARGQAITAYPFTIEAVIQVQASDTLGRYVCSMWFAPSRYIDLYIEGGVPGDNGKLVYISDADPAPATAIVVQTAARVDDGTVKHLAVTVTGPLAADVSIYVDGVEDTTIFAAGSSVAIPTAGTSAFAIGNVTELDQPLGLFGLGEGNFVQDVALYATALSEARISAHAEAVVTPWNNDLPGERAARVLDAIGWPEALRDLDDGSSVLQSADLGSMTALEHLQKVAESELGELYVAADGTVILRGRHQLVNRPVRGAFGPGAGQVGYRAVRFDSSDLLLKNPATVSRAEGVAQTAQDETLKRRFYPHQFTLDGLLHDNDGLSLSMAQLIVSEHKTPHRRITGLSFGPADEARISDWYPLLLEAELGDVYDVTFEAPNVAEPFTQRSTLEGITESWTPAGGHLVTWDLSPTLGGQEGFWQLGVVGRSELGETTRLYV
jgi:hypothetical protein